MNNKEFVNDLAVKLGISPKDAQGDVQLLVRTMLSLIEDCDNLVVQGFGTFEVKKKLERVLVNPSTKQRMLVPPKLTLIFKPSNGLKDKIK